MELIEQVEGESKTFPWPRRRAHFKNLQARIDKCITNFRCRDFLTKSSL
jgi:hypothetical protein